MRILSLWITNFRAITRLELTDLKDTVIIAGPNGCGKSCVFDAIKMLKSAYGDYQANEWQTWLSEFQINFTRKDADWSVLLQDRDIPLRVKAEIALTDLEKTFLCSNADELLKAQVTNELAPAHRATPIYSVAATQRIRAPAIESMVGNVIQDLLKELHGDTLIGEVEIDKNGKVSARPSRALELIFGIYLPQNVGIIDFHGPHRIYTREQIVTVNLNVESRDDRLRQNALYNQPNKYTNLKSELASTYVRNLLARSVDPTLPEVDGLTATLKELFGTFFVGKEFLGPIPRSDGRISFPVRMSSGSEHDIDDLSSGEKEVLYGYLRIRNASPRQSVLLIDEPELHLNPRLIKDLAGFYHRHLGKDLGNQLWLVTHSDALIRDSIGQEDMSVFHMQPPKQYEGPNQVSLITAGRDVDRLVMELVGDLAAYRPNAKIVLFEGGGNSEFDVRMTNLLFARFQTNVNSIAAGSKKQVGKLHELLKSAEPYVAARFYAITDSDGEIDTSLKPKTFQWDVYHIENYLLSPHYILKVLRELNKAKAPLDSEKGVIDLLQMAARDTIPSLISHKLTVHAFRAIQDCVDLGFDPNREDVVEAVVEAVEKTKKKIKGSKLGKPVIAKVYKMARMEAESALRCDKWKFQFRGRDILKRFVGLAHPGITYEVFRDLIVARMRDAKYEPLGMCEVVERILSDKVIRR